MPAGDAGLDLGYLRQTVDTVGYLLPSHCEQLFSEIDRLQAQMVAQQAVVDAARWIEAIDHGVCYPDLAHALHAFDKAQPTQPEGER